MAAERLGGAVLWASDEFFAPKENLLKAAPPVFIEGKYTDAGKWMDGWETRRHRAPDHDWCLIRLGLAGIIRGILVDTSHFKGNYPERCGLEACALEGHPGVEEVVAARWTTLLEPAELRGDARNLFAIDNPYCYTYLRFRILPDGGVARLRVYGEVVPGRLEGWIDLAGIENGGRVLDASDMFFGSRHNLILPGRALGMHDGWETRRRRGPGHDWTVIQLAAEGLIERVEVDTLHFKGNFPESCSVETCDGAGNTLQGVLSRTKLQAHTRHLFEVNPAVATHVRFRVYPDGGVSRLRIWGTLTESGRAEQALQRLNSLASVEPLRNCCASRRWAEQMAAARPFASLEAALEASDRVWWSLEPADWLEAFAAHPRIGERSRDARAAREQAGSAAAPPELLAELVRLNRAYEARFGHIYIVCATGKTAEEMVAILRRRLENDPAAELREAAEQQRQIVRLRLQKI